ncbi:MAG TPA: nickel-dependent lactate racemase [Spirochaetota bacterium]|nr:nickel-dependent lactate racemase [Spirochaetota bacterium]
MKVKLPYGKNFLEMDFPPGTLCIEPRFGKPLDDEAAAAFASFRNPTGSAPLKECIRAGESLVIVISDNTRPVPNDRILPWILKELDHVKRSNITVLVGTGSHNAVPQNELQRMLGTDIVESVSVINHDAFSEEDMVSVGCDSRGREIFLNRHYVAADRKITVGFIEPHFFAGFSGGPKSVLPGVAGIATIMDFHSAMMIADPSAAWGVLDGNPLQEMAGSAVALSPPDFSVHVTLDGMKRITGFFSGDCIESHRKGSAAVREESMFPCGAPFDAVVTTNSGFPLDRNLYQAVKGISAVSSIVKEGGDIYCVAECSDGVPAGSPFHEILGMGETPEELLAMINGPGFSMIEQWQVQKLAQILAEKKVYLYSGLPASNVRYAHMEPIHSPAGLSSILKEKSLNNERIAVVPWGPVTIPYLV